MAPTAGKQDQQLIILHYNVGVKGLDVDYIREYMDSAQNALDGMKEDGYIFKHIFTPDNESSSITIKCVYPTEHLTELIPVSELIAQLTKEIAI